MTRTRRTLQELARLESMPADIPPSLEEAFEEIENLDAMHPSACGQAFGALRNVEEKNQGHFLLNKNSRMLSDA